MNERDMRKSRTSGCGCGKSHGNSDTFDAETAFRRLAKKYDDLAQLLGAQMAQQPLPGNARAFAVGPGRPQTMSEALARIVGGFPVGPGEFPECA